VFHKLALCIGFFVIAVASVTSVHAATCYYVSDGDQGDYYFMWGEAGWKCQQSLIDDWWERFDFDKGDWDDGFGYDDPCNYDKPLARTFNALYALGYARTNAPHCTYTGNPLDWSLCWAGNQIDELDGRCGSGEAGPYGKTAHTQFGPVIDNYTELYWPFFYGTSVVERAAIIFHEARHASYCGHNANRCESCDHSWTDGCSWPYSGMGAITYHTVWLWWYVASATKYTTAMKDRALVRANENLAGRYDIDPCFRIASNGGSYMVC
jgi:hypothetical protein